MQFVFVVKGQGASVPQTLVTDRLLVVATRETVHRKRYGREREKKKYAGAGLTAAGAPLQISGTRLRDLCWSASPLSATLSIERDDLTFHCAMVQTPYAQRSADAELDTVPLRVIAADELEHVYFNLHEDLLLDGRLVVFTHADNLLHVGIDADAWAEAQAAAAGAAGSSEAGPTTTTATPMTAASGGGAAGSSGGANTSNNTLSDEAAAAANSQKRQRRSGPVWGEDEGRPTARRLDSPHTPHSLLKKEQVLAVVPAAVSSEDIKALNELCDRGQMACLDASLADFFCCQCGHLPLLTLTMSCCGAVLCERCAPTPPTVEGVSAADRACPVCGEEPLDPPLSHPSRDVKVAKLVKELKVLYHPQLQALQAPKESQPPSTAVSTPSTPPFVLPSTPVLGPR
ncbi:hypothetical protein ABB37_08664 [Leptomonas pyrrhocoris]|uniref:Uncharacterized protein n=1 Tax=Leptomonas pyrrhocoris TaxID=157538 RepID=A0A0N0DRZ9_LEPPY|nr:hypothetical protein ABB37_08664 [Leptomonas pyrrhocoris]XP_015653827.1 hypothetical protein ABB37_08664 [Leptomonas pyrrhocoris]KPA75387.1 hypothetical protein ABB37_08664 [Leptomonas pyrrhocoris]KPA75388.1 hypothetical protein ABB37_08664 [Leptomonas pyrrhocoris]|eukprot:XP_015653826.1 hypothetical protein ABB37_08664 [Leptomonas pyrrhocoris]